MWELDYKESWALKNWCFWTVVLEKILESPLNSKQIKSVNPKGNQPWLFIGRNEAEAPILWSPDVKSWLTGKRPWCWERLRSGEGDDRWWDLDGITNSMGVSLDKLWLTVKDREVLSTAVHGVTKSQTWLSNWTTTTSSPKTLSLIFDLAPI